MTSSFLCPTCRQRLNATTLSCPNGHCYTAVDGVLALFYLFFARNLADFLVHFETLR